MQATTEPVESNPCELGKQTKQTTTGKVCGLHSAAPRKPMVHSGAPRNGVALHIK